MESVEEAKSALIALGYTVEETSFEDSDSTAWEVEAVGRDQRTIISTAPTQLEAWSLVLRAARKAAQ